MMIDDSELGSLMATDDSDIDIDIDIDKQLDRCGWLIHVRLISDW